MKNNKLYLILIVFEFISVTGTFYSGIRADMYLDNSGMGDINKWLFWNNISSFFFLILFSSWILSIIYTIIKIKLNGIKLTKIITEKLTKYQAISIYGPLIMILIGYLGLFLSQWVK